MDRNKTCGVLDLKCRVRYPHTLLDLQFMQGCQDVHAWCTADLELLYSKYPTS